MPDDHRDPLGVPDEFAETQVQSEETDAPPGGNSEPESQAGTSTAPDDPSVLLQQRDEYYNRLLRTTAEFDNYRKRVERERQNVAQGAAAGLLEELLPVMDDLEQALKTDPGSEGADAYRKGVELIHRQLLNLLIKRGVTPLETIGTDFDPHYHQAVVQEVSPGHREGEIIEEFRRGYTLGTRLLRATMVKVAKA